MKLQESNRVMLVTTHPFVRESTFLAIDATERKHPGYTGKVTSGRRTDAEQLRLWRQGRDAAGKVIDKNLIVTNAKTAEESAHGSGLASDTLWITPSGKTAPDNDAVWKTFGASIKDAGLEWGGDWKGDLVDMPHAQFPNWKAHRDWSIVTVQQPGQTGGAVKVVLVVGTCLLIIWAYDKYG